MKNYIPFNFWLHRLDKTHVLCLTVVLLFNSSHQFGWALHSETKQTDEFRRLTTSAYNNTNKMHLCVTTVGFKPEVTTLPWPTAWCKCIWQWHSKDQMRRKHTSTSRQGQNKLEKSFDFNDLRKGTFSWNENILYFNLKLFFLIFITLHNLIKLNQLRTLKEEVFRKFQIFFFIPTNYLKNFEN